MLARKTRQSEPKRAFLLQQQAQEDDSEREVKEEGRLKLCLHIGEMKAINVTGLPIARTLTAPYDTRHLKAVLTPAVQQPGHNRQFLLLWEEGNQSWGLELDRDGEVVAEWTHEELAQVREKNTI